VQDKRTEIDLDHAIKNIVNETTVYSSLSLTTYSTKLLKTKHHRQNSMFSLSTLGLNLLQS
jgi:hypothetical protein